MTFMKRTAAVLAALIFCVPLTACSKNDKANISTEVQKTESSSAGDTAETNGSGTEAPGTQLPDDGTVSDLITPAEDSDEASLGSYRLASDGVKLYYDEDEYPTEVMLALDRYFTCFARGDYDSYLEMVYPSYYENYDAFLQQEYGYGLDTSFATQCANLQGIMGGDFHITRVKAEEPELKDGETRDEAIEKFFERLNDHFDKDYYAEVKEDTDNNFQYMLFFVIAADDATGTETQLVSEFEILFAEKDGKYYVFG